MNKVGHDGSEFWRIPLRALTDCIKRSRAYFLRKMHDTDADAELVRLQIFRSMSPGKRLSLATGWSTALRDLVRANLRGQFPDATDEQITRLFAERSLGKALADTVYGRREDG